MNLLATIPLLQQLGNLPGFTDWSIARRTWNIDGEKHHQFVIAHPHNWVYEYRCTDNRVFLGQYWCGAPQSGILRACIETAVVMLIDTEWDWMLGGQEFKYLDN